MHTLTQVPRTFRSIFLSFFLPPPAQTVEISGLVPAAGRTTVVWPWTSAAEDEGAAEAEADEDDDNGDDDGKVCAFNCHLLLSAVGTAW